MQKFFCLLILTAGSLFADCASCCVDPCCCEPCDFIPPCPPDTCAYNAPVMIDIKCGWDVYITASFLYFQAKEENLEYIGYSTREPNGSIGETTLQRFGELSFDFEPAFKVGAGFNLGCDNWALNIEYMRYHADVGSGSFNHAVTADDDLDSQASLYWITTSRGLENIDFSSGSNNNFTTSASSKWRLEMDLIDVNLSRKYFVGRCLTFEPHFGLRGGWIDQNYKVIYDLADVSDSVETYHFVSSNSSESWAIGLRAGLNTDWKFCGSFFLFGNTAFSILYTEYDEICTDQQKTTSDFNTGIVVSTNDISNIPRELCFLRPQANIGFGLGWADYFCCNDWFFDFRIGYEFHVFWNQNVFQGNYTNSQDPTGLYGDLYLQGLLISARLDF